MKHEKETTQTSFVRQHHPGIPPWTGLFSRLNGVLRVFQPSAFTEGLKEPALVVEECVDSVFCALTCFLVCVPLSIAFICFVYLVMLTWIKRWLDFNRWWGGQNNRNNIMQSSPNTVLKLKMFKFHIDCRDITVYWIVIYCEVFLIFCLPHVDHVAPSIRAAKSFFDRGIGWIRIQIKNGA